jgi:trimeric autotransporter adhesin
MQRKNEKTQTMKSSVHLKPAISSMLIAVALGYFALSPQAQGVVPAPDGGYPGFNTAEGQNALFSLSTGVGNTAMGWFSLWSNTDGSYNTAVGVGTLLFNVGNQSTSEGAENTAIGAAALLSNTSGTFNTANGAFALFSNTTGSDNTAIGDSALLSNTTGVHNTANGFEALSNNTTGDENTADGVNALFSNTEGAANAAVGFNALQQNTAGSGNTANGDGALFSNTLGFNNSATGEGALFANTTGSSNTATGGNALQHNTTGGHNTAIGLQALFNNTTGDSNTALGVNAGTGVSTASNVICVGTPGENVSNSCYIGQIFNATSSGGSAVFVNPDGKLGTTTSSRRFKEEIKPMDKASEVILALRPVRFRYKKEIDPAGVPQFGLVAEEVAKVNSDLIIRDAEGKPQTVRYEQVNTMLLNEFLKEHHKVKELERGMAVLAAQVKEQAAQIQKVSATIQMSVPAPLGVAKNR